MSFLVAIALLGCDYKPERSLAHVPPTALDKEKINNPKKFIRIEILRRGEKDELEFTISNGSLRALVNPTIAVRTLLEKDMWFGPHPVKLQCVVPPYERLTIRQPSRYLGEAVYFGKLIKATFE